MEQLNSTEYYKNSHKAQNILVAISCLGVFVAPLIHSSVNVAIPNIAADLNATARLMSWVPMAFTLSNVIFLLPVGQFADRFGHKKVFQIGLGITIVGCVLSWLSPNIWYLLALRIVVGIGAAMIFSTSMAIVSAAVSKSRRGTALGFNSACIFISLTVSPLLGGIVTDHFGWRAVMLIPATPALLALILLLVFVKGDWQRENQIKFDYTGAMIFAVIILAFIYSLSSLPHIRGVILLFVTIIATIKFIGYQSKIDYGIVNLRLLRDTPTLSLALAAMFFMFASNFGVMFLLNLFLQYIGKLTPSQAGGILVYQALATAVSSIMVGRIIDRFDDRYVASFGCALAVAGYAWLAVALSDNTPHWQLVGSQMLIGCGFGFFTTPNNSSAMGSVNPSALGAASSMMNLSRNIGNLISMGIVTLVMSIFLGSAQVTEETLGTLLVAIKTSISCTLILAVIGGIFVAASGRSKAKTGAA